MIFNIERTILASILNDKLSYEEVELNKQYINQLSEKDFTLHFHQLTLSAIKKLDQRDMPINEDFIYRELGEKYGNDIIDLMCTNVVANLTPYIKTLKQDRYKRDLLLQLENGKNSDFNVAKIQESINHLENIASLTLNKKIDDDFLNFFDKYNLNPSSIDSLNVEYLYHNMLVKNEVTMIAAKPSSGKSLTTMAFANMALEKNDIDYVFYFDLDNSLTTLKERNIQELITKWAKRLQYIHPSFVEKPIIWRMIKELQTRDLTNCLVVFDSAKNFMIGGDRDKNKDVSKVTEIFKAMRNKGSTVLFLHHTNKPNKDLNNLIYAGSSAWEEDSSNAFILHQNDYKKSFLFTPFKNRIGDLEPTAFKYNQNHTLTKIDFAEASETQEIEQINNEVIAFIEEQSQKPTYSQIMQHLTKEGFTRNKTNEALQNGKGRYWKEEKLTQNNRSVYTLIKQSLVVEYEDIRESSTYKSDKSDKSYKSYFRASFTQIPITDNSYKWQKNGISESNPVVIQPNLHINMPIL